MNLNEKGLYVYSLETKQSFKYSEQFTFYDSKSIDDNALEQSNLVESLLLNLLIDHYNLNDLGIHVDTFRIIESNIPEKFHIITHIFKVFNEIYNENPQWLNHFEINISADKIDIIDSTENIIIFMKIKDIEKSHKIFFEIEEKILNNMNGYNLLVIPIP